jgi:hypothetical protein
MTRIEPLGELVQDEELPEWLVSPPTPVDYFAGLALPFVFENLLEDSHPEEHAAAVREFLGLAVSERDRAGPHLYKNYTEFVEAAGLQDLEVRIPTTEEVWQHVSPTAIHVSRRHRRDKAVYVQITAECDWDSEHGLQIVYRQGRELCRVSSQDGHLTHADAYDLPEAEDRIS